VVGEGGVREVPVVGFMASTERVAAERGRGAGAGVAGGWADEMRRPFSVNTPARRQSASQFPRSSQESSRFSHTDSRIPHTHGQDSMLLDTD